MRKYEVMYILQPKLKEAEAKSAIDKDLELITNEKGNIVSNDWWGIKELAYEIEKHNSGYYGVAIFESSVETMEEFDRITALNDNILRTKILKVGK